MSFVFFFQAEDGIRDLTVTGVQTCALPIFDLGGTTLTEGWGAGSHRELMAAHSLAQTVSANFTEGRRVRVLINGGPAETLGGHVSMARSLEPMKELVDPRFR